MTKLFRFRHVKSMGEEISIFCEGSTETKEEIKTGNYVGEA